MNEVSVTHVYNPLNRMDQDIYRVIAEPGDTVKTLVLRATSNVTVSSNISFAVSVDGRLVTDQEQESILVRAGQHITIVPVLTGGGSGGGKSIIRMVAIIVIAIIAAYVGQAWVGPMMANAGYGSAVVWGAIASSLITMAGALIINAVLPVSAQQNGDYGSSGYNSIEASNSYSWSPGNTQQQGNVIPWYIGKCKVSGNIEGVYRESNLSQQFINVLISLGEGPIAGTSNHVLNDQPIGHYNGVEIHCNAGNLDQTPLPYFGDTVIEYSLGTKCIYNNPVDYTTVGTTFDALEVEVSFPNGLYYYSETGSLQALSVIYQINYRKQGTTTWNSMSKEVLTYQMSDSGYWTAGKYTRTFSYEYNQFYTYWEEVARGGSDPNSHYQGERYQGIYVWQWIGSPIKLVSSYNSFAKATSSTSGEKRFRHSVYDLEPGVYELQVIRLTQDYTDTRYVSDLYLSAVREINTDDYTYPTEALIGVRALATDQLSGQFSFSCYTLGKLFRVYDSTDSRWYERPTTNPAWIVWGILTQPIIGSAPMVFRGYDESILKLQKFIEWAAFCDDLVPDGNGGLEKRITYNGPFDSGTTMWDAAVAVAKIGRATPFWEGSKISISIDKADTPCTLITVGNTGVDSFEETFLSMDDRAGSIEADFLNEENDLEREKMTVVDPNAPASWGTATISLQGVIKPSEIWRHCRYYLAVNRTLTRIVTLTMDVDSIAFTLGSVVNLQHDVPAWGEGGRIVSATESVVVLDKSVTMDGSKSYMVMIRLLDGTLVERTINNNQSITTNTLNLVTPFTTLPEPYDLYAFGEVGTMVKPMRITMIEPVGDLRRKITMIDYNASVYNSDYLEPVLSTPNYTSSTLPSVTGLTLSERLVFDKSGQLEPVMDIKWSPITNALAKSVEVFINGESKFTLMALNDNSATYSVIAGRTYNVQVRTIGYTGNKQDLTVAASKSILILGKMAPPSDVTGFYGEVINMAMVLHWNIIPDLDRSTYEIQRGTVWDDVSNEFISDSIVGNRLDYNIQSPVNLDFMIKAIDTSGNESLHEAKYSYTVTNPQAPTNFTQLTINNLVQLKWTASVPGSFPIDHYELRRGDVYETAKVLGQKYSTFEVISETESGTYVYWVTAYDRFGYKSEPVSITARVDKPIDYVLIANLDSTQPVLMGSQAVYESDGVVAPINQTISWENHFINNPDTTLEPWSTFQDIVDDGYLLYGQPSASSSILSKDIDLMTVYPASRIQMTLDYTVLVGSVSIIPELLVSQDGSEYTSLGNVFIASSQFFRFIRLNIQVSTTDGGLVKFTGLNTKLDVQQRSLVRGGLSITDTVSDGTVVTFASLGIQPFDIVGIMAEAPYVGNVLVDPIKVAVNMVDTVNPTQFKLLAWDRSGNRVSVDNVLVNIRYL